jgi:hypothetical protein
MTSLPGRDGLNPAGPHRGHPAATPAPEPKQTKLQCLQADLLDLLCHAREADERTAVAFIDFLIDIAAREGVRRR